MKALEAPSPCVQLTNSPIRAKTEQREGNADGARSDVCALGGQPGGSEKKLSTKGRPSVTCVETWNGDFASPTLPPKRSNFASKATQNRCSWRPFAETRVFRSEANHIEFGARDDEESCKPVGLRAGSAQQLEPNDVSAQQRTGGFDWLSTGERPGRKSVATVDGQMFSHSNQSSGLDRLAVCGPRKTLGIGQRPAQDRTTCSCSAT